MKFERLYMLLEELHPKILREKYPKLSDDEFYNIILLDPTTTDDSVGKYTNWILNLYINKKLNRDDRSKVTELLKTFHQISNTLKRKRISKYNNIADLENALAGEDTKELKPRKMAEYKDRGSKVIYYDKDILVEIPQSYEQSCDAYGSLTSWCTADRRSNSNWSQYKNNGELYVIRHPQERKPIAQLFIANNDIQECQDAKNEELDETIIFKKYPQLNKIFMKLAPDYYKGTFIRVAGRRLKYIVKDGIRIFKDVDISDANLKSIPDLATL